ncbi:transcriptional regulator [Sphaerisporangium rufum]|uniref:Transcriptional regulator n=1 Tax=Sphaerisporangium rufum TaxID=1381558 RepID=A0A919QY74_9ACTN|nr:GntR family transcriptional regulator [Sphaerisporangium rufum]GII76296.1 transcriptional regulator [Sphaerisporangium rufum]
MSGHAYEHIAAELRGAILDGELAPGTRLPRHADLAARYGVSEIVVRQAIDALKNAGLVETRGRGGTRVRDRPPVRRVSSRRYLADLGSQATPRTSFTDDHAITWSQYRLDTAYRWIEADERLAGLFEVPPGTRILERHFVFYAAGRPAQMSRPCLLAADVEGTPVADPGNEPWPGGTIGQLRSLGIEVDEIAESVATRMPTPEEARTLNLGTGVPVFAVTRRMLAAGRVVEVADPIVIPGDRTVLDYDIVLPPSPG